LKILFGKLYLSILNINESTPWVGTESSNFCFEKYNGMSSEIKIARQY